MMMMVMMMMTTTMMMMMMRRRRTIVIALVLVLKMLEFILRKSCFPKISDPFQYSIQNWLANLPNKTYQCLHDCGELPDKFLSHSPWISIDLKSKKTAQQNVWSSPASSWKNQQSQLNTSNSRCPGRHNFGPASTGATRKRCQGNTKDLVKQHQRSEKSVYKWSLTKYSNSGTGEWTDSGTWPQRILTQCAEISVRLRNVLVYLVSCFTDCRTTPAKSWTFFVPIAPYSRAGYPATYSFAEAGDAWSHHTLPPGPPLHLK